MKLEIYTFDEFHIDTSLPDDTSVFISKEWISAFKDNLNLSVKYLVIREKDTILALLPVFIKRKFGMKLVTTPGFYLYNYIYFNINESKKNRILNKKLEAIRMIAKYLSDNYHKVDLALSPEIKDIRAFTWNKYNANPLYTYRVDLQSLTRAQLHTSKKNSVRNAKKFNLVIEESSDIEVFIDLLKITLGKSNKKLCMSDRQLVSILRSLMSSGIIKQHNLIFEKAVVASKITIFDRRNSYAWQGANDPKHLEKGISSYFSVMLMEEFSKNYDYYDFCGANLESISFFKSGFGGDLTQYFKVHYVCSAALSLLQKLTS